MEYRKRLGKSGRINQVARDLQLIADLSYADILLCSIEDGEPLVLAAAKPNTATSVYRESPVGRGPLVDKAILKAAASGQNATAVERLPNGVSVRVEAMPIHEGSNTIAVVARMRVADRKRRPSEMERFYMRAADGLLAMVEEGTIDIGFSSSKEAGDGLIWIETDGKILYATPNAVTIYKRLGFEGEIVGEHIDELGLDETSVIYALRELEPSVEEISERGMSVVRKVIPLIIHGRVSGVISIISDVTDIRARELELRIKEATIREIHHRVKNNLQTIASLLRLQARRLSLPEAQEALLESVGRISSIAAVHEILSQRGDGPVDFVDIAKNIANMVKLGLVHPESQVEIETTGRSGNVPAQAATPLALVLTELIQNAVEHAFDDGRPGKVFVHLSREDGRLLLEVTDDGRGLSDGFEPDRDGNLGLQIVKTLVEEELQGEWRIESPGSRQAENRTGTSVSVTVPLGAEMHDG